MHRFFIAPEDMAADPVRLRGDVARQIARVLRLRPGERVVLLDGSGDEVLSELRRVSPGEVIAEPVARDPGRPEPPCAVWLYQAVVRPARFEWVLEKATEVGVAGFVPVLTERSVVRPGGDGARLDRWQRIVREAAEQSGRTVLPEVAAPTAWNDALRRGTGLKVVCWEGEGGRGLRTVLQDEAAAGRMPHAVSLFIGPEGGLTVDEVRAAEDAGARVASLGRRVLRSETAGLVGAAAVLYELGDLGG